VWGTNDETRTAYLDTQVRGWHGAGLGWGGRRAVQGWVASRQEDGELRIASNAAVSSPPPTTAPLLS